MSSRPQTEFNDFLKCKVGRLVPTGKFAASHDPNIGEETSREMNYICNNCDYPKGGKAIVWTVNEKIGVSDK